MGPATGQSGTVEDFFLPDLCAPRSVLLMILLAELLVLVHVLAASGVPGFDWTLLASGSLLVQWVTLLSAGLLCQLRGPLSTLSLAAASSTCLLVVGVVTLASSFVAHLLAPPLEVAGGVTGWVLLRNVLVAVVAAGIALRYFYLQHQLQRQEKLELQSRLDSLRNRIRPHFLFNTLNSIASLIQSRPEVAEKAVEDLAELFRLSLREEQRDTTVADELHVCELYLGIEKLRLGERLRVDWAVDPLARNQAMPSLLLQPLVENAIYHGISTLPEGGTVQIAVACEGGDLRVAVENPVGRSPVRARGNKLALENIRRRLEALHGAGGRLEVQPGDEQYRVELRYPRESPA